MTPLLEPKRSFSICGEGASAEDVTEEICSTFCSAAAVCNSKLPRVENERSSIGAAPEVDVTCWSKPDVNLLESLQSIVGLPEDDSSDEETDDICSSEEETNEIGSVCLATAGSNSRVLQTVKGWSSIGVAPKLDGALWSRLYDDLLFTVIARLPSPGSLFRASTLSKEWQLRFRSASFQHEVECSSSSSWSSFCPLLVSRNMKALLGFERNSRRWCRLPTLSYLPEEVQKWTLVAGCGSLLSLTSKWPNKPVFVTNPLTGSWRRLPPCPESRLLFKVQVHIVCEGGSKTYKVFISYRCRDDLLIWIFDSTDSTWTTTQFSIVPLPSLHCCSAVINGVLQKLFAIAYPGMDGNQCYARNSFDLEQKIWKGVSYIYQIFSEEPPRPLVFQNGLYELFVCGSKVLLVATQCKNIGGSDLDRKKQTLSVFELDLDEGWALELSRAPIELLNRIPSVRFAACHGDCIYIGDAFPSILYNVATRDWFWCNLGEGMPKSEIMSEYYLTSWRWAPITYQPGLNPWLDV